QEATDVDARPSAVRGYDSGSGVVEEAVEAESHEIPGFASLWCQVQYIERSSCLTPNPLLRQAERGEPACLGERAKCGARLLRWIWLEPRSCLESELRFYPERGASRG